VTPAERAARSSDALWEDDHATRFFGMERISVTEGRAVMRMTVREEHCNGHGICHGGVIFSLADSAFAFACNSRNVPTVAQMNTITFIVSGAAGDELTAEAREVSLRGRSGIYDITVTRQGGEVLAEMRGHSRAIPGQLFEEET